MAEVLVEYVGLKDRETDCVAGTGLTWVGVGSRHRVPEKAWEVMQRHPDVWRRVAEEVPKAVVGGLDDAEQSGKAEGAKPAEELQARVDAMSDDAVREAVAVLIEEQGLKPLHPRLKIDKVRAQYLAMLAEQSGKAEG